MSELLLREDKGIVTITLNRPEVRNALSTSLIQELRKTFERLSQQKNVRAVLLKGEGKAFCAGADLNDMKRMVNFNQKENVEDALQLHAMFESLATCAVPVVLQAHGSVFGGGLGLVAAADVVFAETNSQFCFSEVKLGLAPAVISDFILRKCSHSRVSPWMISGQVFTTSQAQSMGLVHFEGFAQLENWLQSFREAGPEAVRSTKSLLKKVSELDSENRKQLCAQAIAERRVSAEGQEGLKSFFEKRNPAWRSL